ncbi:GNAT family N-acetyltransferase [Haloferax sp. DFSO60]|uniref:GNAT family N-acetyltransferase n=1 Tax=Haloferax sp. DFSO60 TaxID=3388652 RepID=UPI00397A2903
MHLSEATADDIPTLIECWYALATETEQYDDTNEIVYDSVGDVPEDGFRGHLERDDMMNYLIEEDDTTLGFVTLRTGTHPSRAYTKYIDIVNLLVKAEYRSQGYGAEVVERVKERAKENGCDHLKVSCEWYNRDARRFYKDTGFEEKQVKFVQKLT